MSYPIPLQEIIDLFEGLSETERREALWSFAEAAAQFEPVEGESYLFVDVRKDEQCLDRVGVYLSLDEQQNAFFRIQLGPKVQTLTRALAVILCKGLNGQALNTVASIPDGFISQIVGEQLMRLRSQTVYYILERMREAAREAMAE